MLKKILLLLLLVGLATAALGAGQVPTQIIPAGQKGDAFDAEFADSFDQEFSDGESLEEILIDDPLEGFNRGVFWVNDKLYFYLLKPVTRGYRWVLPRSVRTAVNNAFYNVATPARAVNDLLQLKGHSLATELYRFIVNSSVGVLGLFDAAEALTGVGKVDDEDFGQTLGYYGAGHGFYLVLPLLGPSSLRDGTGLAVDSFADPLRYADLAILEYAGVKSSKVVNTLSLDRDTYEGIVRDSLDPYLFIRAAYAQRRLAQIGKIDYDIFSVDGTFLEDILSIEEDQEDSETFNLFRWLGL